MSRNTDSDTDSDENRSLTSRIIETLRHPLARKSYTLAFVVFFAAAYLTDGQGDLYNRITLTTTLVAGGVFYLVLSLWASGVFRDLARWTRRGARRARRIELDVDGYDVVTVGIAVLVVVSGFVAVAAVDSPSSPVHNSAAETAGVEAIYISSGNIVVLESDGTTRTLYSGTADDTHADAYGDLDGDGDKDVVFSEGGVLKMVDGDGNTATIHDGTTVSLYGVGGVADYDDDSTLEVAVRSGESAANGFAIYMVEYDGSNGVLHNTTKGAAVGGMGAEHDGKALAFNGTHIGAVSYSGTFTPYFSQSDVPGGVIDSTGDVVDFDGDGVDEITFGGSQSDGTSAYLRYAELDNTDHTQVTTFKIENHPGQTADFDDDGNLETIVEHDSGNNVEMVETDGSSTQYGSTTRVGTIFDIDNDKPDSTSSSSSTDTYEQQFNLVDYTDNFPDPTLLVEQYNGEGIQAVDGSTGTAISETDWLTVDETTFNHDDEATVEMEETARHRLTLTDGDATYQEIGFRPSEKPNPYNLTIGTPGTPTPTANATATPTANTSGEACAFTEADDGDYELACIFDDEVTSYEFNLSAPNGSYYEGSLDFDEPTTYYEGEFDSNFTENLTDGESVDPEDLAIDYSGTYANGTSFNGTTSLFGTSDDGGGFSFGGGPTGKSGGGSSGLQQAGGIALLGGVAILGYRRFSDQSLTETASSAASVASSAAGRVASAASGVVGRLRGGGRG